MLAATASNARSNRPATSSKVAADAPSRLSSDNGGAHARADLDRPALAPSPEARAPRSAVSKFNSNCIGILSTATAFAPPQGWRPFGFGPAFTGLALLRSCLTSAGPVAPRPFVLRVSSGTLAPAQPSRSLWVRLSKRRTPVVATTHAGKRQISDFASGSWLIPRTRLTALHFRSTGARTYGFYCTPPRGPPSVWHPSGRAVVSHSSALASSVLSSLCQGLRFGLSPPVHWSCQTHSPAGIRPDGRTPSPPLPAGPGHPTPSSAGTSSGVSPL